MTSCITNCRSKRISIFIILISILFSATFSAFASEEEVNLYSARKEALILPLLKIFEAKTGIKTNLITAKADALLKRLELEGRASPADVFITTDAGRLFRALDAKVLRPITNQSTLDSVPANLRDPNGYWVALSIRARTIMYAKDRVNPDQLSTYEALAEPQWKGRVCIRSSSNIYNQSMVASMIEHRGVEQTEQWAKSLVANMARPPAGGDTDQLRATAAGVCDVAIANTYYFARLLKSTKSKDTDVANKLGLFWPNQADRGTHVNISGAAITRYAKNPEAAERLIAFLLEPEAQKWYGEENNEYPVISDTKISATLKSLGSFKSDDLPLAILGSNNRAAVELMDRAGWR
ncbi:MAG: iron(III) transport system substrate-binding protein [Gammaproteobacteria bacterium]|jgi:iron(III) transport system substrate-binding protein